MRIVDAAGERDFLGPSQADDAPQRVHDRRERERDFALAELGTRGGITNVAHHGQVEAAGNGRPADRGDDRLLAEQDGAIGAAEERRVSLVGHLLQLADLGQVEAGREAALAAGEHHHIDVLPGGELGEQARDLVQHVRRQRIAFVRTMDGDGGDLIHNCSSR